MDTQLYEQEAEEMVDTSARDAKRIGWAAFLITAGSNTVMEINNGWQGMESFGTILGWSLAAFGVGFGLAYTAVKVIPRLFDIRTAREMAAHLVSWEKWADMVDANYKRVDQRLTAMGRAIYELREAQETAEEPTVAIDVAKVDEGWKQPFAARIDDTFFTVGVTKHRLPEGLTPSILAHLASARWNGLLPTVSALKLNGVGISRHNGNPAAKVLEFLKYTGAIEGGGDNKAWKWTMVGERTFPLSPTPPHPPTT